MMGISCIQHSNKPSICQWFMPTIGVAAWGISQSTGNPVLIFPAMKRGMPPIKPPLIEEHMRKNIEKHTLSVQLCIYI